MITKLGKENLEKEIKSLQKELDRTYKQRNEAAAEGDLKKKIPLIFSWVKELLCSILKFLKPLTI